MGLEAKITAFDDYDLKGKLFQQEYAIFIISTTGQGEPCKNMKKSWELLLNRNLTRSSLANLKFTVFGLGDSGYTIFNAMARKLNKRL